MPQYIVQRTSKILNKLKKPLNGSKILILGIAYKSDIDDYRESPALKIIELLKKEGANVKFNDPYISSYKYKGKEYYGVNLEKELLKSQDIVVIITGHSKYDYEFIIKNADFIFDTRNVIKSNNNNIEVL